MNALIYYYILVILLNILSFSDDIFGAGIIYIERLLSYSLVILILYYLLFGKRKENVVASDWFYLFQYILVFIPSYAFLTMHENIDGKYLYLITIALVFIKYIQAPISKFKIKIDEKILKYILIIPTLILTLSGGFYLVYDLYNINSSFISLFDLNNIYFYREKIFRSYSTFHFISYYFYGYYVLPTLAIIYCINRKISIAIVAVVLTFMLYLFTGIKTYLLVALLSAVAYKISNKYEFKKTINYVVNFTIFIILAACLLDELFETTWFKALFLNRTILTPGQTNLLYGDYFMTFDKFPLWQIFETTRNGLSMAEIVQVEIFGSEAGGGIGANTGIFGSAYALYGWIGIGFYSVVIALILGYIDEFSKKNKYKWIGFTAIPAYYLFTNLDFIGVFLYFGLMHVIILINFYKIENK